MWNTKCATFFWWNDAQKLENDGTCTWEHTRKKVKWHRPIADSSL